MPFEKGQIVLVKPPNYWPGLIVAAASNKLYRVKNLLTEDFEVLHEYKLLPGEDPLVKQLENSSCDYNRSVAAAIKKNIRVPTITCARKLNFDEDEEEDSNDDDPNDDIEAEEEVFEDYSIPEESTNTEDEEGEEESTRVSARCQVLVIIYQFFGRCFARHRRHPEED